MKILMSIVWETTLKEAWSIEHVLKHMCLLEQYLLSSYRYGGVDGETRVGVEGTADYCTVRFCNAGGQMSVGIEH